MSPIKLHFETWKMRSILAELSSLDILSVFKLFVSRKIKLGRLHKATRHFTKRPHDGSKPLFPATTRTA